MVLADERQALFGKPVDHPDLPEGATAVKLDGHQAAHQIVQLDFVAGRRHRAVVDVVGEVERFVVDPHRKAEVPACVAQPLAVAAPRPQSSGDQGADVVVAGGRPLEHGARREVHVGHPVFDTEDRGIESTQAITRNAPHPLTIAAGSCRRRGRRSRAAPFAARSAPPDDP
jgi:hypothetical protein